METDLFNFRENRKFHHQLPGGRNIIPSHAANTCVQMDGIHGASNRVFRR